MPHHHVSARVEDGLQDETNHDDIDETPSAARHLDLTVTEPFVWLGGHVGRQ